MGKQSRRNRTPRPYKHRVVSVFERGAAFGYIYTVGLHPRTSELCAMHVPRAYIRSVQDMMNRLSERTVADGHVASTPEDLYVLRAADAVREQVLKQTRLLTIHPHASILEASPAPLDHEAWAAVLRRA